MYKILFWVKNYVYKACNTTILNLSVSWRKDKFGIVVLQAQINYICCCTWLLIGEHYLLNILYISIEKEKKSHALSNTVTQRVATKD
jgi:hypothetical protein